MKLTELQAFEMYRAVKAHFTSDYDFFAYKGKMRSKTITLEKFAETNYYSVICKLAHEYKAKDLLYYFVSNMLINNGQYIFDVDSEGKRIYNDYLRRKSSRSYTFKQDIHRIYNELDKLNMYDFWDSVKVDDGQHPLLFRMFVGSYLTPETMCILYQIKDFITPWDIEIHDSLFYPVVAKQIRKLSPFIMIKDHKPFISIIDSNF